MTVFLEKFFTHINLSHFVVHKETFLRDLDMGEAPTMLVLSIAALSSRYCLKAVGNYRFYDRMGGQEQVPRGRGQNWAERATVLALQHIDRPTLVALQSIVILSLYWYGMGQITRAFTLYGIAVHVVRVLKLDRLGPEPDTNETWVEYEHKKRVFWAVWQIDSFATTESGPVRALLNQAMLTPLPSSEDEYTAKKSNNNLVFRLPDKDCENVMGKFLQATDIWY
jgi:hypothetical protein